MNPKKRLATKYTEHYLGDKPSPKLDSLIVEAEKEIASGKISRGFTNVDDFMKDLNSK